MIKVGQLVRIIGFGRNDAFRRYGADKTLIGLEGRFIEWRESMTLPAPLPKRFLWMTFYAGDFEFDPDIYGDNQFQPSFREVRVEPVEEQNES